MTISLPALARATLAIVERGGYLGPAGEWIDLRAAIDAAVTGTRLFTPEQLDALLDRPIGVHAVEPTTIEVSGETTQVAARRLVVDEGCDDLVLLNFASAKTPGGGFLDGAKAQEEDLARASALHACLIGQTEYYEANRACGHAVYTDHLIWSPKVPFFRVDNLAVLDRPFVASVITCPAPNARALQRDWEPVRYDAVLVRRAGKLLAAAQDRGHRRLLLGAWGCGAFRNDPRRVADVFAQWLASPRFVGAFERVVFAVWDGRGINLPAFERRFATPG
ncbi:TIGR02452 family protein [Nannocystaceae bacterium ST9]